jgi:hypothetical protein
LTNGGLGSGRAGMAALGRGLAGWIIGAIFNDSKVDNNDDRAPISSLMSPCSPNLPTVCHILVDMILSHHRY